VIPRVTMRAALADNQLLGGVLDGANWAAWRTLLVAAMGEKLSEDERVIFQQFTGRDREPGQRAEECTIVKGRRAGGSRSVSVLAAYIAGLCEHPALVPSERGVLLIVAADNGYITVHMAFMFGYVRPTEVSGKTARERDGALER
jgi:hypothetical protein